MDIQYICEFVHLAGTCSFQKTAADLYVSQSSLSKHIQSIEQELNVTLFNRSTRKVVLSRYGEEFYIYAKQIADLAKQYTFAIEQLKVQDNSVLSIGAIGSMNFYGLYSVLSDFEKKNPHVKCSVTEARDHELEDGLKTDSLSFVFTSNPSQYPGFIHQIWKTDPLVLITAREHPLAKSGTVSIEQLKDCDFILHGPPMEYSRLDKLCKSAGFAPRIARQVSFSTTIVQLVSGNYGISVIEKSLLGNMDLSQIAVIPFLPEMESSICCIYKNQKLSAIENEFLSFLRQSALPDCVED